MKIGIVGEATDPVLAEIVQRINKQHPDVEVTIIDESDAKDGYSQVLRNSAIEAAIANAAVINGCLDLPVLRSEMCKLMAEPQCESPEHRDGTMRGNGRRKILTTESGFPYPAPRVRKGHRK